MLLLSVHIPYFIRNPQPFPLMTSQRGSAILGTIQFPLVKGRIRTTGKHIARVYRSIAPFGSSSNLWLSISPQKPDITWYSVTDLIRLRYRRGLSLALFPFKKILSSWSQQFSNLNLKKKNVLDRYGKTKTLLIIAWSHKYDFRNWFRNKWGNKMIFCWALLQSFTRKIFTKCYQIGNIQRVTLCLEHITKRQYELYWFSIKERHFVEKWKAVEK